MSIESSGSSLIDSIVAEYLERKQAGESPSIEDYCQKHPQHAEEIRALLRTVDLADADLGDSESKESRMLVTPEQESKLEHLAGYRVIREIGRGGMGIVYEVEHEELGRRAALKVLPRQTSENDHAVRRFIREGKAIACMHHSNIVPLFEVGEEDGRFFLAMQFIDGPSLDHVIRQIAELPTDESTPEQKDFSAIETLLPALTDRSDGSSSNALSKSGTNSERQRFFRLVARIGTQTAEALSYAHRRGFVHRDVKPSNLLLDENGVTWLTDFGLAKSEDDEITHTGDFVGTLRYMAPERFKGLCDERSDIYGLGLTLYELLTLAPAFESSNRLSTIRKITTEEPASLRSVNRQIPRDLETIVMKAIEKEPYARYSTAKAFAQDLSNFVNDLPIRARRLSVTERLWRWSRRNKSLAAAIALALSSLVALAVVSTTNAIRENGLRIKADSARKDSEERGKQLQKKSIELRRNLYFSEINSIGNSFGNPGARKKIAKVVERWRKPANEIGVKGWEWFFLAASTEINDVQIEIETSSFAAAWSPDGEQFAVAHEKGVYLVEGSTGTVIKLLKTRQPLIRAVAWHPDGQSIAFISHGGILQFLNVETGEEIRDFVDFKGEHGIQLQWDPSGEQLAIATHRTFYTLQPFESHSKQKRSPVNFHTAAYLNWNPDGTRLAAGRWFDNELIVIDVPSNKQVGDVLKATMVSWDDSNVNEFSYWIHGDQAGAIAKYDGKSGLKTRSLRGHTNWARSFHQVSSHRQLLLSSGSDWKCIAWDLNLEKPVRTFAEHDNEVNCAQLNPDALRAVSVSMDAVWLWCVEQPIMASINNCADLPSDHPARERQVKRLSWHPNGKLLATAGWDGFTRVWDVNTKKLCRKYKGLTWTVDWARDGSKLAIGTDQSHVAELIDGQLKEPILVGGGPFNCWNHDGSILLNIGLDKVRTFEFPGNKETVRFEMNNTYCPDWHPTDPDVFAFLGQKRVCISDHGELRQLDSGDVGKYDLEWSPDGKRIATANDNGTVTVFNVDRNLHIVLAGHDNQINDLDWHPDGSRLATASNDGTVKIWDTETWQETLMLDDLDSGVSSVAWSKDGQRLAAGDRTGHVIIWDASRGYD